MHTEQEAESAGFDAGYNGSNTTNCHFSLFATPAMTKAWERGHARGKEARGQSQGRSVPRHGSGPDNL
jgi:hypothetical protein